MRSDLKIGIIVGVLLVVGGVIFLVSRSPDAPEPEVTPAAAPETTMLPPPQTTPPPEEQVTPPPDDQQVIPPDEQKIIPPVETTPPPVEDQQEQRQPRYYTVKQGDTLSRIAVSYFADEKFDAVIQIANQQLIKDKDMLQLGWRLRIPYPDEADQIWKTIK